MKQMRKAANDAAALLRTIANKNRLLVLCQLSQGEQCVSELEEMLGIHQPTLSQQLSVLRNQQLVVTRREGKQIYYSVSDPKVLTLLKTLYGLYCQPPKAKRRGN